MKNLICLCFLLVFVRLNAQTKASADTTKKIFFSEIVKVDSSNRFELYKKATAWIESQKFEIIEEDALSNKLVAKNKVIMYTDKSVLAKPNGEFNYDILIEIKDGKYRYLFSNFVYRYYKMDRNGKYVPVAKSFKPMEDTKAPGWTKQWNKNKMQITANVNGHINSLRNALKYVAPKTVAVPKPKEEW